MHIHVQVCRAIFHEDTQSFLDGLESAMRLAENEKMIEWLENRKDDHFFDLKGTCMGRDSVHEFIRL